MNNVVDEVLNTAQTDNKIKYKIIHADSTEEIVQLELYTPVTTEGTALNKVLFDSIADDINSRLLISNKASNAEAQAGTDTSKYIVPSTLQAKLNKMNSYKTGSASGGNSASTTTIFQPSDIGSATTGTVIIDGYISTAGTGQHEQSIVVNGGTLLGYIQGFDNGGELVRTKINGSSATVLAERSGTSGNSPFKIIINLDRQTILIKSVVQNHTTSQSYGIYEAFMRYGSLTNVRLTLRSGSSGANVNAYYTVAYTR